MHRKYKHISYITFDLNLKWSSEEDEERNPTSTAQNCRPSMESRKPQSNVLSDHAVNSSETPIQPKRLSRDYYFTGWIVIVHINIKITVVTLQ